MNPYEKEGQSAGAVGAIIALIVGVGISVMVLIFVGALGGQTYNLIEDDITAIGNRSVINATYTPYNISNTGISLGFKNIHQNTLVIHNVSTPTNLIGLGNYSVDYTNGLITPNFIFNGTPIQASFYYGDPTIQAPVKASILSGFEALEQTGNYVPIIVLAVVISLVLTIVLGFTAFGGMGRSGGAL